MIILFEKPLGKSLIAYRLRNQVDNEWCLSRGCNIPWGVHTGIGRASFRLIKNQILRGRSNWIYGLLRCSVLSFGILGCYVWVEAPSCYFYASTKVNGCQQNISEYALSYHLILLAPFESNMNCRPSSSWSWSATHNLNITDYSTSLCFEVETFTQGHTLKPFRFQILR